MKTNSNLLHAVESNGDSNFLVGARRIRRKLALELVCSFLQLVRGHFLDCFCFFSSIRSVSERKIIERFGPFLNDIRVLSQQNPVHSCALITYQRIHQEFADQLSFVVCGQLRFCLFMQPVFTLFCLHLCVVYFGSVFCNGANCRHR